MKSENVGTIRSLPTLISKREWFWYELPLTFILGATLDREYIDQYAFKVEAVDGGGVSDEPPQKTEVSVTVRLEDINDNVPKFERDSYSIEFSEDAKIGKDGDTNSGKFLHPPTHCLLSSAT